MFETNLELGVLLVLLDLDGFGVLPSGLDQKFLDLVDLLGHVPISKIRSLEVSNSQIFASNRQKKESRILSLPADILDLESRRKIILPRWGVSIISFFTSFLGKLGNSN